MDQKLDPHRYFSRKECLKGRDKDHPLSSEQEANLIKLLEAINGLREAYGKPMHISSLYRPAGINAAVGGAKKSAHLECLACDFVDQTGEIDEFCLDNLKLLESLGLYLESPNHTVGWSHVQIRPTKNRVFIP
jgi:hypothetical protein